MTGIQTISAFVLLSLLPSGVLTEAKPSSQSATGNTVPLQLDRLDPAIDAIVPKDAKLERVATGFTWVEGPVWMPGGYLFFAEITSNSIRKLTPSGDVSIFLQPSGYQGTTPYPHKEPGTNGMTLDRRGRLTIAGHAQRDVFRIESLVPGAPHTILADTYQGKRLNSPNDLVYKSDGSLYFTDPPYGLPEQPNKAYPQEQAFSGVYRIPNALSQKPGAAPAREKLQLLVSDLPKPNGIAFSPDEKFLYVSNSGPKKLWMRYTVKPDGTLTDAKVFYDASADQRPGVPDGMKVDRQGNIYSSGPGGIWIISPAGKPLAVLHTPLNASNVAWAGADRKTLYITATDSIYRIHLNIPGA